MREKNIINSKNLHRCLLPFMAVTLIAVSFVVFLGSFHGTSVLINLLRYLAIFNIAIGFALLFIAIAINQKENNSDTIEIQTEKTYLQLHYDLLKLAESEKNINEFAPKILRKVCKTFDFDVCELWLIDESKNILRCIDIWHKESQELKEFDMKSRQNTFAIDEELPGRVWKTKKPLWIHDYAEEAAYARSHDAKKAGLNSSIAIPILYQDKVFGVMEFFSKDIKKPDEKFLELMKTIGQSTGNYLERFQAKKQLQDLSRQDLLTNLLNRSALEDALDHAINEERLESIAVIILDIDRFKLINEALSYELGDELLKIIAKKLVLLNADQKTKLGRLSGDKFIFYIENISKRDAANYCHKLKEILNNPFNFDKKTVYITASVGVSIYPEDGLNAKILVTHTELALANAKEKGGNRADMFTKEMAFAAKKAISMETELRIAITNNQFFMLYQPQVDLKTNRIVAAEALVRWQHPTNGIILPSAFIPFAEKNGLITLLNEHIMRLVFQEIALETRPTQLPISINISAQQFKEGFYLLEYLEALIKEFRVPPAQIHLEITENMLMEDTEHNIAVLTALHELGFKIAIDDFGTGFSSFAYISRLPINIIKIDQSFVLGIPENSTNTKIVKAIITMAHALEKNVVAEGVETEEEAAFLLEANCDLAQGFYYYKPMTFETLMQV